jgi:hypothetical protein
MIVVGKARKNQKISEIKRGSASWRGLAGDLMFFGKNSACVKNLPHLAPQKNIWLGGIWVIFPYNTLCGV